MRYLIYLLAIAGCSTTTGVLTTSDMDSLKSSLRISGETIVAKQDESLTILKENTTALVAIRDQIDTLKASQIDSETGNRIGGDLESDAPQNTDTVVNESQAASPGTQPVAVSAVQLFITTADFYCPPCERMKKAFEAGEFAEFDIKYVPPFDGQKSFPATRFASPESPTGWLVVYGYDDTTLAKIKEYSGVLKVVSIPSRPAAQSSGPMSTKEMVSLHNQLHGGGQWTWPGDLAKHLQTTHGVTTGGAPLTGAIFQDHRTSAVTSQRSVVRSFPQRTGFFGWSRNTSRSTCPTCPR